MAALAVSFGLQFREAFDIAHLKKKKSLYENHHPRAQSLSDLNVSWSCQYLLYFYGICDISSVSQTFCLTVTNEPMYCMCDMEMTSEVCVF